MMHRVLPFLFAVIALALLVGAPALAEEKKADKPGQAGQGDSVQGTVVSYDKGTNTLTVKDAQGKEHKIQAPATTTVSGGTAKDVSDLKAGDRVRITLTGGKASKIEQQK